MPLPDQVAVIDFRYLRTMVALLVDLKSPYNGNRCILMHSTVKNRQWSFFFLAGPGAPPNQII